MLTFYELDLVFFHHIHLSISNILLGIFLFRFLFWSFSFFPNVSLLVPVLLCQHDLFMEPRELHLHEDDDI